MSLMALIDADSFYASTETLFDDRLRGRALVVMSSNDGNVIARSKEAKAMGIAMGERASVIRELQRHHDVVARSANFALYGDISRRIMRTIATLAPRMEVYSIDEAFIHLDDRDEPMVLGRAIRARVAQWCGIPVSIGIAPTKVLAKVATRLAKKQADGVVVLPTEDSDVRAILQEIALTEVWGIATGFARRLETVGMRTACDVRDADPAVIRQLLGVVGARIAQELRGDACLALETQPPPRKSLVVSRSFGRAVHSLPDALTAIATHVQRAGEKLRHHGLLTGHVHFFLHTNPFSTSEQLVTIGGQVPLGDPTNDTCILLQACRAAVTRTFRPGLAYVKGGVLCLDLHPAATRQTSLLVDEASVQRRAQLFEVMDQLNRRARGTLAFARSLGGERWRPRAANRSPHYTTRWEDLPQVR